MFACILVSVFHREQRQKEATKTAVVNSFPKDRDYRREAMQASAAPGFTGASKCCINFYNIILIILNSLLRLTLMYRMSIYFVAWLAQNINRETNLSKSL